MLYPHLKVESESAINIVKVEADVYDYIYENGTAVGFNGAYRVYWSDGTITTGGPGYTHIKEQAAIFNENGTVIVSEEIIWPEGTFPE